MGMAWGLMWVSCPAVGKERICHFSDSIPKNVQKKAKGTPLKGIRVTSPKAKGMDLFQPTTKAPSMPFHLIF